MNNDLLLNQLKDTARELRQFQLICFSMIDAVNGAINQLLEENQAEEVDTEADYEPGLIEEVL